jgi:DNA-binding transcriptional ArsR family regulator
MYDQMLKELCGSEQRYRIFRTLFGNPGRAYHVRGLATAAGVDASNVSKLLPKLVAAGLVDRERGEPNAQYRARRDNPLLQPLTALFSQASNLVSDLRAIAQTLDADVAIFGSTVSGADTPDSDVDVLVIGPISQIAAQAAFKPVARRYKRPVNVTVIESKKLQKEIAKGSAFWRNVLSGPTVPLKGTLPHAANS